MGSAGAPKEIEGFHILQLSLPSLPSFPVPATHYLYVKAHEPKIPDPTTPRSLFLVNIPFDSTLAHFKHLFSVQLDLPAGRVEDVQFEGEKRKAAVAPELSATLIKKNKKRKRDIEEIVMPELEGEFPEIWDRKIHRSGSNAVLLFVDQASKEIALKA